MLEIENIYDCYKYSRSLNNAKGLSVACRCGQDHDENRDPGLNQDIGFSLAESAAATDSSSLSKPSSMPMLAARRAEIGSLRNHLAFIAERSSHCVSSGSREVSSVDK